MILLLGGNGLAFAGDCLLWVKRTDVGSYGQRWQHAMAYDSDRGVTVFFGGEIGSGDDTAYFNDTQEYDGKQWRQINTAVKPAQRSGHTLVYDAARKKIVLFGGYYQNCSGPGFCTALIYNDTWVYTSDGNGNGFWELQLQATNIPPLTGHGMVWSSYHQAVLVHGGSSGVPGSGVFLNNVTWKWDGTNWQSLTTGPALSDFGMASDFDRFAELIVGGFTGSDEQTRTDTLWENSGFTGGVWVNRGPGPPPRAQVAMAFDARRLRAVVVGGVGQSIETGESAYEFIPAKGWVTIPSLPSGQGRAGARMVYDRKRGVMVLTGGAGGGAPNADSGGRYSDTWELWPSLFISGQPLDTTNEVCTTAMFSAGVQGNPPLQYNWLRDGKPLSADERFVGVDTPELKIVSVRHADAGKYELVVRDSCDPQNVVTSRVATLTTMPESEWAFRTTNGPGARFGHGMVYDSARHVTVLFGGRTNVSFVNTLNDLWEWDGARWNQRVQNSISNGWKFSPTLGWRMTYTNVPVRRAHFAMAYDSRRGRTLIFGGYATTPDNSTLFLRDLWEWDGASWHFRGTNGPVPRYYGSMAYDERRGVTVLFGGSSVPDPGQQMDSEYVWEWDGDRWHTNRPALLPRSYSATHARMTYDSFRAVVVFGPSFENYSFWSFWDWDGDKWIDPAPVVHFTDPIITVLHGTVLGGFAFDANRRRNIWFGGINIRTDNKTALFDAKNWTLFTNSVPPPPRMETAMAYDSHRRMLVMFGGNLDNSDRGATNDTWELAAVDVPVINEHPASQIRFAGQTATFHVSATGHGFVAYQWYFQTNLIVGAQSDTLTIPGVGEKDVGEYYVRVGSQCGSATSRVARLTLDQKLQIFSSAAQSTLIWPPGTSFILEVADSVEGPWTIVPNPSVPFSISALDPAKFYRLRAN